MAAGLLRLFGTHCAQSWSVIVAPSVPLQPLLMQVEHCHCRSGGVLGAECFRRRALAKRPAESSTSTVWASATEGGLTNGVTTPRTYSHFRLPLMRTCGTAASSGCPSIATALEAPHATCPPRPNAEECGKSMSIWRAPLDTNTHSSHSPF
jgi:hypothetical protein